jgi:flavin-dependent dehydrogenase
MTMRSTLDEFIARQAVETGAELKDQVTLKAVEDSPQRVLCETSAGFFTSDFLIGADGANSLVARSQLEFLPPRCGVALEGEVSLASQESLADYSGRADFDFHVLPQGYGWVFPKADHLSVGVLTLHAHFPSIKRYYNSYVEKKGLAAGTREARVRGHLIPLGPPTRMLNTRRLLLAGDAAGLADPLTGEGISYAVRSGRLAAETMLAALRNPGGSLAAYSQRVRKELLPEIKLARLAARCLYAAPESLYRRFARKELFAQRVLDVFEGKTTYRALMRKVFVKPYRLLGS